jgi:Leucine-rich repeat (LRR) protein
MSFHVTSLRTQNVLGGLPKLRELNLYGNRLSEICNSPQGCCGRSNNNNSKLVVLNVAYNDLVCLPETLFAFPRLESLIASHNFLAVIPQALVLSMSSSSSPSKQHEKSKSPRLRHLDVTSNPVTEPPVEVCEQGLHKMRQYYKLHPQQQRDPSSRRACACCTNTTVTSAARRRSRDSQRNAAAVPSILGAAEPVSCYY